MSAKRLTRYVFEVILFIIWVGPARDALGDTAVLLTTITNPAPTNGNLFGYAVAPFGADRLLITAPSTDTSPPGYYPGAVSLFTSNGVLLTTITNPSGRLEESFGAAVTGVGNEWVVVGTPYNGSYIGGRGTVYMFNTNGILLRTLTHPKGRESLCRGCGGQRGHDATDSDD